MPRDDENKDTGEVASEDLSDSSKVTSNQSETDELVILNPDVSKWTENDWNKLRARFRQIIFNRGLTADDADEIINETVVIIWRDQHKIEDKNPFYWSISVLENVNKNYKRKKIRKEEREVRIDIENEANSILISTDSYDKSKEVEIERESTLNQCAEECLDKLPAQTKSDFLEYKLLRHNSRTDRNAIAKRLGKSNESLRTFMSQTLRKIKDCVNKCMKRKGFEMTKK